MQRSAQPICHIRLWSLILITLSSGSKPGTSPHGSSSSSFPGTHTLHRFHLREMKTCRILVHSLPSKMFFLAPHDVTTHMTIYIPNWKLYHGIPPCWAYISNSPHLSVLAPMQLKTHNYQVFIYISKNLGQIGCEWAMSKIGRLSKPWFDNVTCVEVKKNNVSFVRHPM